MTDDHQATQELLAGYALRSLSGEDAAAAQTILDDHLPACADCRGLVRDLSELTGELALAADPLPPPDTLLPRIHREMEPRERRVGRIPGRGAARIAAVAAGILVVVGVGGLALRGGGAQLREGTKADLQAALALAQQGAAQTVAMGPATEVVVPGREEFYVVGEDVPAPPPGMVYRLWLVSGVDATAVGDFRPAADGTVVLLVEVDPAAFDQVLVTVEPEGSEAGTPGQPAWDEAA